MNATDSLRAAKATLARTAVPGLLTAGALGALAHLRNRVEHAQLFVPEVYPNGIWDPSPFGIEARDQWFQSADGTELHGWWMPTPKARGSLLYCHGNAGNLTSQIGAYRQLRKLGLNVFAFDYRGYGRSEGRPSEHGLFADVRAAYRHLTEELGEDPSRIVLYGHSLGGAVAIDAAVDCEVAALIVQATFTNTREVARERFRTLPVHWFAPSKFRSIEKVPDIDCPKFFLHGTEDGTIPHAMGDELFQAASEPKQWATVERAGHLDVHRQGGLVLHWRLRRFVHGILPRGRSQAREV